MIYKVTKAITINNQVFLPGQTVKLTNEQLKEFKDSVVLFKIMYKTVK